MFGGVSMERTLRRPMSCSAEEIRTTLVEYLLQKDGSALCQLLSRHEYHLLVRFGTASLGNQESRQVFYAGRGLCNWHFWELRRSFWGPALAETLFDILRLMPADSCLPGFSPGTSLDALPLCRARCWVCWELAQDEMSYVQSLVHLLEDPGFRGIYGNSHGLCLPHVHVLAGAAGEDIREWVLGTEAEHLQQLKCDLAGLVRKARAAASLGTDAGRGNGPRTVHPETRRLAWPSLAHGGKAPMKDSSLPLPCVPTSTEEPTLFSCAKLLKEIQQQLEDGHKVMLVGPEGIGKSALIHALLAAGIPRLLDRTLVICRESTGVRAILDAAGEQCAGLSGCSDGGKGGEAKAYRRPGRPQGGLRDRLSALYHQVQQGRWLFVLDHLSSWDPGIRHVLEYLFAYDVLALGAARGRQNAELGNVAKTLWRWKVIKVPPLTTAACKQLLEHLTHGWSLDASQLQHFCHRLIRLAEGNPGRIVGICQRAEA